MLVETAALGLSSVCTNAAGMIVIFGTLRNDKKSEQACSMDLMVCMLVGNLLRAYWSHSPPPVWNGDSSLIQLIAQIDTFISPLVWALVIFVSSRYGNGSNRSKSNEEGNLVGANIKVAQVPAYRPRHAQWQYLTLMAVIVGLTLPMIVPYSALSPAAFPLTISSAITGCVIELCAFIPQIYLTAYGYTKTTPTTDANAVTGDGSYTSVATIVHRRWSASNKPHFVGFLCMARVFRAVFWFSTVCAVISQRAAGDLLLIMTLVLPEAIHTMLVGDFLVRWLRQLKESAVDPFVHQVSVAL